MQNLEPGGAATRTLPHSSTFTTTLNYAIAVRFDLALLSRFFFIAETSAGLLCALMYPNMSKGTPNGPNHPRTISK